MEDLRAKVDRIENAKAAIDERMREIGRQSAQEGRDFDGRYYRITLFTGLADGIYTVYNVGEMKEAPFPTFSGSDSSIAARAGKETSSDADYTGNQGQNQEEKTPMQRAKEDTLRKKGVN